MRAIIFAFILYISSAFTDDQLITESVCEGEIERIAQENYGLELRETYLTKLLIKYKDNEISADLFSRFAAVFCTRMLGQTQCLFNVLPTTLNSICTWSYAYDAKMTKARMNRVLAEFYCEHNMKRLNDTLQDDGITCLYTQNFMDCKLQHITANAFRSATENVCESLNANILCENSMGHCVNAYVKQYQYELSRLTKRGVGCPL